MFISNVNRQERRSSNAIEAYKLARRASEMPPPTNIEEENGGDNEQGGEGGRDSLSIPQPKSRRASTISIRRRSSLFRPPAPVEPTFSWKYSGFEDQVWSIVQPDGSETTLIHRKNERCSMKNFGIEVRGLRDVDNLLADAVIILRPKHNVLSDLMEEIIGTMNEDDKFYEEVRNNLFTDKNGHVFANTLQGFVSQLGGDQPDYDPSWLCAFCNLAGIRKRSIAIVRMKQPTNFGETCQEVWFFILVICPSKSKETKTALETSRTFATLFSDPNLRNSLLLQPSEDTFKNCLSEWAIKVSNTSVLGVLDAAHDNTSNRDERSESITSGGIVIGKGNENEKGFIENGCCRFIGRGIRDDLKRRLPHYLSDYTDGIADGRAIQKTVSTSVFLYFACLLPTIAFATLNSDTTHGRMDVRKGIFAQTVGQLVFAVIGGQHLSILLTTAPLSLFVKIIFSLSEYFDIVDQFEGFYCCVGLWTSFFLFLSAILNMSKVMKYCTRSTEEIFALFISIAFLVYAIKDTAHEFKKNYNSETCAQNLSTSLDQNNSLPASWLAHIGDHKNLTKLDNNTSLIYQTLENESLTDCHRDSSLLYLLLMFGTFWLGFTLYNFKNTPFLQRSKREILSDYSLPIAVIAFSFIGSFLFNAVPAQRFEYDATKPLLKLAPVHELDWTIILLSGALGFCLAVLIFMDQNIGSAIVNNPTNKLTKGASYNWDLVVISIINMVSSLFALPWLHVALPHAPMHVKCLADIEERVEHGQVKQTVIRVRETRLTTILSHVLMGLSLLLLPVPLEYILPSVFDGLYLYMGITALGGNQLFERILLIFTEQLSYPPNHYIRQVPQRKIHQFTLIQVLQLALLCVLGFSPYPFVKVLFPLVLLFLLFTRQKILPKIIEKKYLDVLD